MLWVHIVAGSVALLAGAAALIAFKGGTLHRRSGLLFVISMLLMTSTAVVMAAYLRPNIGNVIAGVLTTYLVLTGLLAVKRTPPHARAWSIGLMLVAFAVGGSAVWLGWTALANPRGAIDGIPAPAFFMFATVGLMAAALDARVLRVGELQPRQRLARHLWRLGYAMWIATLSAFLGQADLFPPEVRASGVLLLPLGLVTATLLYWIVRIHLTRFPLPFRRRAAPSGVVQPPTARWEPRTREPA